MHLHSQLIGFERKQQQLTLQDYEQTIAELEAEVMQLKNIVSDQASLIEDLQCQVDPYSCDGSAICNIFSK